MSVIMGLEAWIWELAAEATILTLGMLILIFRKEIFLGTDKK